jgi:choice-of-anchor B domain-containing protein
MGSRKQIVVLLAVTIGVVMLGQIALRAHDETPEAIEGFLHGLVETGAITEAQHEQIKRLHSRGLTSQLSTWLAAQETANQISRDTHLYVNALLNLSTPETSVAAAPANYSGNGNVVLLGRLDSQPPNPYYGDNSSTGTLYNGIWGYATGSREYALQCNSYGLHIIDVTNPAAPFQVQYIDMSGGVNPPKGRIWRDVDIHRDPVSGKTYAYIGAQSNGNLWIVDLSHLSGSTSHAPNSNPIPAAGIADRGRTNYGHTMFVNDGLGLMFMNSANNGSTLGCQIFDLLQNPFNPPIIAGWSGSGHDCHDSFARANVPGSGGKDLLYVADGYATTYRVVDISSVRTNGTTTLLGSAPNAAGIYAHSNWLDDDSHYLYAFDEFNVRDIGVYDVSDPANPTQVTTFQYSGDATANSRIHNGQVRGNYLITAYYEAGLRVFDISNPANPVEVGKYETWRDPDGNGVFDETVTGQYNGAWNIHVFLPSGNVLLSDMKSGTFVFRVDSVAPPGSTNGLVATPGNGQVALSWSAASGATGYSVQRSTSSGGPYTTIKNNVTGTSFTDTGLTNGATYFYIVTATNAGGSGGSGTNPFTTHGTAHVDVQRGGFSGSTSLQTSDFQAGATAVQTAILSNAAADGVWSEAVLNAVGIAAINKAGTTQLRIYFTLDDNDNRRSDSINYYSGETSTAASRPQLVVTYR